MSALTVIPNDDRPWSEWNNIGMAVWRATGGSEEGREAFHTWSEKYGQVRYREYRCAMGALRTFAADADGFRSLQGEASRPIRPGLCLRWRGRLTSRSRY